LPGSCAGPWKASIHRNHLSQITNADIAIVLGGGNLGATASPGNRAWQALELYKARKVMRIPVTGRQVAVGTRVALIGWGVPKSDVLIEPESTSTSDEANHCKRLIRREKVISACSSYPQIHKPRALIDIPVIPAPIEPIIESPVLGTEGSKWRTQADARALFRSAMKEWTGNAICAAGGRV
jgi:hypothetical protein